MKHGFKLFGRTALIRVYERALPGDIGRWNAEPGRYRLEEFHRNLDFVRVPNLDVLCQVPLRIGHDAVKFMWNMRSI